MPFRDRTGPLGQGPGTGWGAGPCGSGRFVTGRLGGFGRGFGRGSGRGFNRGFGGGGGGRYRWFQQAPFAPEQERSWLENQVSVLQAALKDVNDRLEALKSERSE